VITERKKRKKEKEKNKERKGSEKIGDRLYYTLSKVT